MIENVRKVFDMLGVEPYEKFQLDYDNRFFYFGDCLNGYVCFDENDEVGKAECNWLLRHCLKFPSTIIKTQKAKKHVGDLICTGVNCDDCPLKCIVCKFAYINVSLYEKLEDHYRSFDDKEIYDILKKRLDEEVEDE